MKKAWKWVAAIVGLPAACVALLWLDSVTRAAEAIRAEDERLARDIAAARSRRSAARPVFPLDEGHTRILSQAGRALARAVIEFPERYSAEEVLADLATLRDRLSEGGYDAEYYRYYAESGCLSRLEELLEEERNPGRFSEPLRRIEDSRPTLAEIVTGEHLVSRAEALRVLHRREDPTGFILRPPGWREFFSWRILIVKILRELDDHHREVLDMMARQAVPAAATGITHEDPNVRSRTELRLTIRWIADREMRLTRDWDRIRLALKR